MIVFALLIIGAVALWDVLGPLVLFVGAWAALIGVGFLIAVVVQGFCELIAPESGRING